MRGLAEVLGTSANSPRPGTTPYGIDVRDTVADGIPRRPPAQSVEEPSIPEPPAIDGQMAA